MMLMVKRKPYHALLVSTMFYLAWCVAFITPVVVVTGPHHWVKRSKLASLFSGGNSGAAPSSKQSYASLNQEGVLPSILSKNDISLYKTIFAAQRSGNFAKADAAIDELSNKLLLGHVLAERYLSRNYDATPEQLADWLKTYNDHPEAPEIYAYAIAKSPALKQEVPSVHRQASLEGYGDDKGMDTQADTGLYSTYWHAGLDAWKTNQKHDAARLFAEMAAHESELSPWMASASAYWAYRSYNAIGNRKEADRYLQMAANHPRSFYGILARKQLNQSLDLDISPVELTDSDVLEMVGDQTIRRVVALAQAGFNEMAEKELRISFPQADDDEKPRLLALAHELGLASIQISMARYLGEEGHELDFARYPIPSWQPDGGFKIDPLLIFSLMRQESGFRPSVVSPGGALGLMQLMPQTASLMQKQMGSDMGLPSLSGNVSEPTFNITLGQNYVQHLLSNNLVDGNLVYLLAAYNAGPGKLQEWKNNNIGHNDPLLFVESIPYGQTRHYVMQVMTNYWIYSELAGAPTQSATAFAHGNWPSYDGYQGSVASADTTPDNRL